MLPVLISFVTKQLFSKSLSQREAHFSNPFHAQRKEWAGGKNRIHDLITKVLMSHPLCT